MKRNLTSKVIAAAIIATIAAGAAAGAADAAAVKNGTKQFGDCTLSINVSRTPVGSVGETAVTTNGSLSCTRRHPEITITTTLKMNGVVEDTSSVSAPNWTGGGRVLTAGPMYIGGPGRGGCQSFQGVFNASISDLGATYVTTSSPITLCP